MEDHSERRDGWAGLDQPDHEAMEALENYVIEVGEGERMKVLSKMHGNKALADFAEEVYRVLHWIGSPDCRANHPDWNPVATAAPASSFRDKVRRKI